MENADLLKMEDACYENIRLQRSSLDALASCFHDEKWNMLLNEKDSLVQDLKKTQENLIEEYREELLKEEKEQEDSGGDKSKI